MNKNIVLPNSIQAWVLAARPKTLAGAATPVLIGSALAFMENQYKLLPSLICLLFALLMQVAANFINDLFDHLKGSDREDRLGPKRACAEGWITPQQMKKGILITLLIACLLGLSLIYWGGWWLISIGILCVAFAFLYTAGPYPLAYHGWGDLLVLLFFGFVPVGGTFYIQTNSWNYKVTLASMICGLIVNTLLVVNNYRDYEQDKRSGKKTLIVRFGKRFGERLYLILGLAAAWLSLGFIIDGHLFAALLPQLYIFPHMQTWRKLVKIEQGSELNQLLGESSQNMLLMAILLSLGMMLSY